MVGLVGNWVLHGYADKVYEGYAAYASALYANFIGGPMHKVLDHATSTTPTPEGDLLVMGGTVEQGEGLYRISTEPRASPSPSSSRAPASRPSSPSSALPYPPLPT